MLYYIDFSHHFHVVNRLFTNPRSTSPLAASTYSISIRTHHLCSNRTWMITPLGKWLVKVSFPILRPTHPRSNRNHGETYTRHRNVRHGILAKFGIILFTNLPLFREIFRVISWNPQLPIDWGAAQVTRVVFGR